MTKQQKLLSKELFKMAYNWGRWNIVVDENGFAWQTTLGQLLGNKSNGYHKIKGGVSGECFVEKCKLTHLPF